MMSLLFTQPLLEGRVECLSWKPFEEACSFKRLIVETKGFDISKIRFVFRSFSLTEKKLDT
jgi:hypothetical protein